MKICRFVPNGWPSATVRSGVVLPGAGDGDDRLVDLAAVAVQLMIEREDASPDAAVALAQAAFSPSTVQMLGTWQRTKPMIGEMLDAVGQLVDPSDSGPLGPMTHLRSEVTLLSPVDQPPTLRDFFAFEDHMKAALANLGKDVPPEWYEAPSHYVTRSASVFGPDEVARWPHYTEQLDFELEFAIVIGAAGIDIPTERAWEHIAGFTIFNDLSCRDVQRREMGTRVGPAKTKGFDGGSALGPYLVTTDEVPNPFDVEMRGYVNDELWSTGRSGSIYWSVGDLVAAASAGETLLPGDVLGSGTVGTGAGIEIGRWVAPGDVVRLEIDGLGALEHRLVREPHGTWGLGR